MNVLKLQKCVVSNLRELPFLLIVFLLFLSGDSRNWTRAIFSPSRMHSAGWTLMTAATSTKRQQLRLLSSLSVSPTM